MRLRALWQASIKFDEIFVVSTRVGLRKPLDGCGPGIFCPSCAKGRLPSQKKLWGRVRNHYPHRFLPANRAVIEDRSFIHVASLRRGRARVKTRRTCIPSGLGTRIGWSESEFLSVEVRQRVLKTSGSYRRQTSN